MQVMGKIAGTLYKVRLFACVAYTRHVNDDAWTCTDAIVPIPYILFVIP